MKRTISILCGAIISIGAMAQNALTFDVDAGVKTNERGI